MNPALKEKILSQLSQMEGQVGFYYKNLVTGETLAYHENEQFMAASVVKLPLLAAIMLWREQGKTRFDEHITVHKEQMHPDSSGVLAFMTGDEDGSVTLDIKTLCNFMIIISDTTATNALYHHYGNELVIATLRELGLSGTQFNREYYDSEREDQGIQNYFVPAEIGTLLEKIYNRTLVSVQASEEMEKLLLCQQVNHKMGGSLPMGYPIAHKTGEEEDKTHDVGIVFAREPFVACFASCQSDIPEFENFIRQTTRSLVEDIDPELRVCERMEDC